MENKKNIVLRILLYILSFIIIFVGIGISGEGNVLGFLICSILTLSIYSFLILKNYKILSPLSSITFILISILILAISSNSEVSNFETANSEKLFMISLALVLFFYIIVGILWYMKDKVWKKVLSIIFISFTTLLLHAYGFILPAFYQNFVYTRLFILIFFLLSIFLILKGKIIFRILGIVGIFLSIGILLFSAVTLSSKVYTLEGDDKGEVVEFIDTKAKEMLSYYNEDTFTQDTFCKYCGPTLTDALYSDLYNLPNIKESYGDYIDIGEPYVYRSAGMFYIEYPVKFEKVEDTQYVIFVLEGISSKNDIFGFAISDKLGEF